MMQCRAGCGACCIAPSITSPLPGMPQGKPAGSPCVHLSADCRCALFGDPRRPAVCIRFQATPELCGESREQALQRLAELEALTAPAGPE